MVPRVEGNREPQDVFGISTFAYQGLNLEDEDAAVLDDAASHSERRYTSEFTDDFIYPGEQCSGVSVIRKQGSIEVGPCFR